MEYSYNKENMPGPQDPPSGQASPPGGEQTAGSHHNAWSYPGSGHTGYQQPYTQYGQGGYTAPGAQTSTSQEYGSAYRQQAHAEPQYNAVVVEPPVTASKKKGSGRAGKAIIAVALVAACGVAGFGGGYAAVSNYSGDNTVVYKTPEPSGTSGVSTSGETTLADIADAAGQSVVSITTENEVVDFYTGGRVVSGAGSGVIISADGTIITNNHVISGASNVIVTLADGTEYPATLVGTDPNTDIAVIKIEADGLTPAVMGDSKSLRVGERCIAIGNPLGTLGGTVTDGIVSALDREITVDQYTMNLLQMSAAVSPGNSGGGLFNDKGELIGIVNAKSSGDGAEGLGFAIPVDTALSVAEELITNGYVTGRPGLGVTVQTITTAEEAQMAGVSQPGLYVDSVNEGSAAANAGIQAGDRIVEAGGVTISSQQDLSEVLKEHEVGDALEMTVERNGATVGVTVKLQELNA